MSLGVGLCQLVKNLWYTQYAPLVHGVQEFFPLERSQQLDIRTKVEDSQKVRMRSRFIKQLHPLAHAQFATYNSVQRLSPEEVVQVYGFCIRTLRLPVISVMIIGVMRFSYNDRAVLDGRFRHHLFQAVFMRTTYPSRCVYFGWSRVHTAVESAVTAPVGM